jgi:glycosyltransferase involved in cell wall biosynthesis
MDSVLTQSYPYVEHIVVDGGSSDGTVSILQEYAARWPGRLRYLSERDNGIGEALNKGLKMMKGDLVSWLGSDDTLAGEDAIQAVVKFFTDNPDAHFVHGHCKLIDKDGRPLGIHKARSFSTHQLVNEQNYVACGSAFYRKSVVDAVGEVDQYGNDYDYMIRIAEQFPVQCLDRALSCFRVHPDSETGSMMYDTRVRRKDYLVARRHGARLWSRRVRRYYGFVVLRSIHLIRLYYELKRLWHRL